MKKSLSLVLVLMLVISMLSACGKTPAAIDTENSVVSAETTAAASTAKEPITLTWFGAAMAQQLTKAIDDSPVMLEFTKRTGITIDHSSTLGVTDQNAKLAILLASGDLPDIVTMGDGNSAPKVLQAKMAIPLDDLIKSNGKDLAENCKGAIAMSKVLVSDEKNTLYFIPGNSNGTDFDPTLMQNGWNLRWDLYKKLGYPAINNYDDFLKVLQDMVKLEPTNKDGKKNYGLGLFEAESWGTFLVDKPYANYQGIFVFGSYAAQIDTVTDKIVPRLSDPDSSYWQAMKFWNKAYQLGILDPESGTLKYTTFVDKAKTGRYMAGGANWVLGGADQQFIADKTPEKGYVPFLFANNEKSIYVGTMQDGGDQYLTFISNNCKTPDRAMDFLNYLGSVEGATLQQNGIEGKDYTIKDGLVYQSDEYIKNKMSDPNYAMKTGVNAYNNWRLLSLNGLKDAKGTELNPIKNGANVEASLTAVHKDFITYYKYKTVTEAFTKVPKYLIPFSLASKLKTETGSELATKDVKIQNYSNANEVKVMFTKTDADFETAKAKFIADVKTMGADELVAYFTTQYDDMKTKVAALMK